MRGKNGISLRMKGHSLTFSVVKLTLYIVGCVEVSHLWDLVLGSWLVSLFYSLKVPMKMKIKNTCFPH